MAHRWGLAVVFALALVACASPQTTRPTITSDNLAAEQRRQDLFVLESRAAEYRRVYDIAERLSSANAELCARRAQMIGVRFENLNDYSRETRNAAQTLWGLNDRPSVVWVGADSPAARAGLRPRDQLIAINGQAIRAGRNSSRQALNRLRDATAEGPVVLQIMRGAETIDVTVTPEETCAYQFFLVDGDDINAAADGRTIYLNRGMLRFVRTDEELALVLGHELAHNAMRHIEAMQTNAMMGTVGGAVLDILAAAGGVNTGGAFADAGGDIGRMMFSQAFESEADYVGLYFTARAGFDTTDVESFWRRMAAENPRGIRFAYSHPNSAERYLGLAAARLEISNKLAAGLPLRPNMRGERAEQPSREEASQVVPPAPAPTPAPEPEPLPEPTQEPMAVAPQL